MERIIDKSILLEMIEQLDLPDYVVEKAIKRYESLGEWFGRETSIFKDKVVDIFPQGSFALGTTIKPLNEQEGYDLDIGCKINVPSYKNTNSQGDLKKSIGQELEAYRIAKGIQKDLCEKHRCWRLEYKDEIQFHLDIVPCIPLEEIEKNRYEKRLNEFFQYDNSLIERVGMLAVNITDDRHAEYNNVPSEWKISNPQGYIKWFEEQMTKNQTTIFNERASVEPIPIYSQKTILQRCIQLLKRHRDNMFGDDDRKPISIIITTLAARAYDGEQNINEAILNILTKMPQFINSETPRIPNPVNPNEDFSDRWEMPESKDLDLEGNFRKWLMQVQLDFKLLLNKSSYETAHVILTEKFALRFEKSVLQEKYDYTSNNHFSAISSLPKNPPRPWSDGY